LLEGKMLLAKVADHNNNAGRNTLTDQCVYVKDLNEQFQKQVIEDEVKSKGQKIAHQLYPSPQVR